MDSKLRTAYRQLEDDVKSALKEHRANHSVMSVGLNALLMYPDHPWDIGDLYGYEYDPETQLRERFLIAQPEDLDQDCFYAKERRLIETRKGGTADGPPLLPRLCGLYPRARCDPPVGEHSGAGGYPRRCADVRCAARKAGSLV